MTTEHSLIKLNSGLLATLSGGGIDIDVFSKEIVVLKCVVAGTSYRQLDKIANQLTETTKLTCRREAKNQHDRFAVALWWGDEKIGYIPREKNEVIARMLDAGKTFYCTIRQKEWLNEWLRLKISVIWKD